MKISNEFYQRGLTIINSLRIFGTRRIKSRKNWPIFSSFNPFPSMPSVATDDRKQFQYLQIVFNNKTRSLVLGFNWCKDTFKLFIKMFAVLNSLRCAVKTVQNYLNHLNSELGILFQRPREASSKFQPQKRPGLVLQFADWRVYSWKYDENNVTHSLNYLPLDQPLCSGDISYSSIWPQCWSKAYQGSNWT